MVPIPCPQPVRIASDVPKGFRDRTGTLVNVEGNLGSVLIDGVQYPFYLSELVLTKG